MTEKGFLFQGGAKDLIQNPLQGFNPEPPFIFLNTSTVPLTPSVVDFSHIVQPPDYSILDTTLLHYGYNVDSTGCTATITGASITLGPWPAPRVIYSWFIKRNGPFTFLWGGNLETPVSIPLTGASFVLEPITITMGTCSATPPPIIRFWDTDADNWESAAYNWESA